MSLEPKTIADIFDEGMKRYHRVEAVRAWKAAKMVRNHMKEFTAAFKANAETYGNDGCTLDPNDPDYYLKPKKENGNEQ